MKLNDLRGHLTGLPLATRLEKLSDIFPDSVLFTTSFGIEDQVITHEIFSNNINIRVSTLDTGRLFPETYEVFSQTILKYGKKINVYFPDYLAVEKMVTEKGPFSFYDSVENRQECCRIRKVVPLNRALAESKCWISGIRADQSDNRGQMSDIEYDFDKGLFKFHPLFDWTLEDVEKYLKEKNVPYNSLHDKGYPSIGCEPCTRAVTKGQDFRSGRWWWETEGPKECGCHVK